MLGRIALLLTFAFCIVAGSSPACAGAANGAKVVYSGSCVVVGGIRTQSGAPVKAWEMWQEIFLTGAPTWLQAHTHHGAECIMNVYGVTSWWFEHGAASRSAPPTIVPVSPGHTAYTVQGRVHTAGDLGPGAQAYLGIHLLEQGSEFSYTPSPFPSTAPSPVQKTSPVSIFKNKMQYQVPSRGTVTIKNQMIAFESGAAYTIDASPALGYYTVVTGGATIALGGTTLLMAAGKTITLPRNVAAKITATLPTMLAATELVPQGR
jgi:hypothetical protein